MAKERPSAFRSKKTFLFTAVLLVIGFLAFEIAYIKWSGSPVARPTIPRKEQVIGSGPNLRYVILGDSTAISQGGNYQSGYAVASANYLAQNHTVTWKNVAASGARAKDIAVKQVPEAVDFKPDLVLIAVGANDVTHLTNISAVRNSLKHAVTELRVANPAVRIVVTGSPDMGSVPRFAQPARWLAGKQTERLNASIIGLAHQEKLIFAPIALRTGPLFRAHPELFAADKFHPTNAGYKAWIPVIDRALDQAMSPS
jgi:lysophospholipase L1-like esterase